MPKIVPYRPFFYSSKYQNKLGELISPPYDVISPQGLETLKKQNELNSVRLCLADDANDNDRYKKMRSRYEEWKSQNIFETSKEKVFCLIEEKFEKDGVSRQRIGFIGLLESTPFDQKQVLPHEHTLSGPKADRLELLKTLGAEFSQVLFCYKDPELIVEKLYDQYRTKPPAEQAIDPQGIARRMWLIDNAKDIATLQTLLADKSVLIADGHHRYETSVHFKKWDHSPKSEYVQGYFTNLDSPGFSILPIHRLFSLPEDMSPDSFQRRIEQVYETEEFAPGLDLEHLEKMRDSTNLAFLCAMREPDRVLLLQKKKAGPKDAEIFSIHKHIFEAVLGWDVTKLAKGVIQYEHDTQDFKKTLLKMERGVGLFLPPTDLNLVMDLAKNGERMPQKSTFFYPKLASGFVNYELGSY
jgi:uncharacterized protein (DUF1015 family)